MKELITKFADQTTSGNPGITDLSDKGGDLTGSVQNIITAVIGGLGIVAVVVIIIGGVLYMTSGGDQNKVKKAKDTILYGMIGLAVCVLAFAIAQFFINAINGA